VETGQANPRAITLAESRKANLTVPALLFITKIDEDIPAKIEIFPKPRNEATAAHKADCPGSSVQATRKASCQTSEEVVARTSGSARN
jgi:hypothetical protein